MRRSPRQRGASTWVARASLAAGGIALAVLLAGGACSETGTAATALPDSAAPPLAPRTDEPPAGQPPAAEPAPAPGTIPPAAADAGALRAAPPDAAVADAAPANDGKELELPTPITPSAGCAAAEPAPAQGVASLVIRGVPAEYLVTLPDGYDGVSPVPLIFGFHGRARSYLEFHQVDATGIDSELGSRALMVYPQAQGGEGWTNPEELPPNIEFFAALYQQLLAQYCVDRSHVFAVGHSSGGFFSHILACRYGERLRGIGVVEGTLLEHDCTGHVAALMIHSPDDSVVTYDRGVSARDFLLARNGCSSDTQPGPGEHCVSYQGCAPAFPVAWCEHDEPTYDDTHHGWPSFASQVIGQFFFSLP